MASQLNYPARGNGPSRINKADFGMNTTMTMLDEAVLVRVEGAVNGAASGQLYDVLVAALDQVTANLLLDLSEVSAMTRAGVRGILVAAFMLTRRGAILRICGANAATLQLLQGLGYDHLFSYAPSVRAALQQVLIPRAYGDVRIGA